MSAQKLLLSIGLLMWCFGGVSNAETNDIVSEQIDRMFRSYQGQVPGASVLVVKEGEIKYAKGYGLSDYEDGIEAHSETNYRLASVSKAFTAMAVMILKDRGLIDFDDAIGDYIERFPSYGRRITVRHLLGHTSGLRDYESYVPSQGQVTDRDVVQILRERSSTYYTPGSRYRYSNSGYATLAVIVENVSGMSFSEFLEDNVFAPLRMDGTVAYVNGVHDIDHRAFGYTSRGNGFTRTDQSTTSAVLGDGGVYTSALDYFKWDQALYSDQLVSEETMAEAFTSGMTSSGAQTGYGFGWKIGTYRGVRRISHTGSTIGFRTAVQRFPDRQLTVLVLINRANTAPWDIAENIADLFL